MKVYDNGVAVNSSYLLLVASYLICEGVIHLGWVIVTQSRYLPN